MEQPSGIGTFSSNQAKMILEQLGYEDITTVPVGRGNDYLSAMVRIVGGEFEGIDLNTVIQIVREENNARENTQGRP